MRKLAGCLVIIVAIGALVSTAWASHITNKKEVVACTALLVSNDQVLYHGMRPSGALNLDLVEGEQNVHGRVNVFGLNPPEGYSPFDVCANAGGADFLLDKKESHGGILAIQFNEQVPHSEDLWEVCVGYSVQIRYSTNTGVCKGRLVLESQPFQFVNAWVQK
jgi:hypothetical protein